jgi:methanogenic corrinoid protein MtbC1
MSNRRWRRKVTEDNIKPVQAITKQPQPIQQPTITIPVPLFQEIIDQLEDQSAKSKLMAVGARKSDSLLGQLGQVIARHNAEQAAKQKQQQT